MLVDTHAVRHRPLLEEGYECEKGFGDPSVVVKIGLRRRLRRHTLAISLVAILVVTGVAWYIAGMPSTWIKFGPKPKRKPVLSPFRLYFEPDAPSEYVIKPKLVYDDDLFNDAVARIKDGEEDVKLPDPTVTCYFTSQNGHMKYLLQEGEDIIAETEVDCIRCGPCHMRGLECRVSFNMRCSDVYNLEQEEAPPTVILIDT